MDKIKYIVAIASGKGGVGKSTTSANLALAMSNAGWKMGMLDADIYGPSQQLMMGVEDDIQPVQQGAKHMQPVIAHGIETMSMGYLVKARTPMVWRGPMAGGALAQMLGQTLWSELDCLLIDMPPGTGDIQLTVSQKARLAGVVIVTTPQDIALLDARKGIEMFRKVDVPVLGVIENMSQHVCRQCGHMESVFGDAGAARLSGEYQTPVLGSLPLAREIREDTDRGVPSVIASPDSAVAKLYDGIAEQLMQTLEGQTTVAAPTISVIDD